MTDLEERRGLRTDLYEPAEDSRLLLTACREEIGPDERVLDVGTGTGYVAARLRAATAAAVVGVDISPVACGRAAAAGVPVVRGDLVAPFRGDAFDVVVCNPPYLPTPEAGERTDWLSVATAGGPTGRAVVERLLADIGRVLRPAGRGYLLTSSLMDVDAVRDRAGTAGFETTEIARDDSFPFEVLSVLRLSRPA